MSRVYDEANVTGDKEINTLNNSFISNMKQ